MAAAYSEGQSIKDELLDASTAAMRYNPVVFVPASDPGGGFSVGPVRVTTGSAYVDAVEAQANAQREEACARILSTVNDGTSDVSAMNLENFDPSLRNGSKGRRRRSQQIRHYRWRRRWRQRLRGGGGGGGAQP